MRDLKTVLILVGAFVLLLPSAARAQDDEPLSALVPNLYFDAVVGNLVLFETLVPGSSALIDIENQLAPARAFNGLLGAQLVAFPVGSSAGGFTWTFNPGLGTFQRDTTSFGPMFTERPLTVGRHRLNVGATFQRATFDKMENRSLRDGDIRIYTGLTNGTASVFIEDALDMELSTNTIAVFGTFGVTDRLDVGIAVPIVHVSMRARLDSRFGTQNGVDPEVFFSDEREGSASGVGDLLVRARYNLLPLEGGGIAVGTDLRLPTGKEEELLGIAGGQAKVYVAVAGGSRRVSPHVNFGYTFSGESDAALDPQVFVFAPADEINYAGGVDVAITPRLTFAGDFVGRTLRDLGRLNSVASEFGSQYQEFEFESGNMNVMLGAAGIKFSPGGNGLITANLLFPLNQQGLRDNLTWVIGAEYSF